MKTWPRKVQFKATPDSIEFYPYASGEPYSVTLQQMKKGLHFWIDHLSNKRWWNSGLEIALIDWATSSGLGFSS